MTLFSTPMCHRDTFKYKLSPYCRGPCLEVFMYDKRMVVIQPMRAQYLEGCRPMRVENSVKPPNILQFRLADWGRATYQDILWPGQHGGWAETGAHHTIIVQWVSIQFKIPLVIKGLFIFWTYLIEKSENTSVNIHYEYIFKIRYNAKQRQI